MPNMFRAGGKQKFFRSIEEGKTAGYLPSYNDVAKQCGGRSETEEAPKPLEATEAPAPTPPAQEKVADPTMPPPVTDEPAGSNYSAPRRPLPDLELGEVKAKAVELGIDPEQHHMTLRKQVEDALNVESGSD